MRPLFFLALLCALVAGLFSARRGSQALSEYLTQSAPTAVSYHAYTNRRVEERWLRFEGCLLSVLHAIEAKDGPADTLFVPLYDSEMFKRPGASPGIVLIVETDDPALLATWRELQAQKTPEERFAYVAEHRDRCFIEGPIEGTMRYGVGDDAERPELLVKGTARVHRAFALLEHGSRPTLGRVLWLLAPFAGPILLLMLWASGVFGLFAREGPNDDPEEAGGQSNIRLSPDLAMGRKARR